ncbi:MAG TPA: DNA-binding protein YbiB [Burkholderiaceae bacterium]|nr:DNA-binding protein YbiB [Burkholderiaceae bacterium]
MDAQPYLKEIGRGRDGARGLSYESAFALFEAVFDGGFAELELGAILIALRMKGESLDEIRAALDALSPRLARVPVDASRPVVSIPSYNGARHVANLVPLLACLLADAGMQVVIHGTTADPVRTTTSEIMRAMGLGPVSTVAQAGSAIARGDPAFVPVDVLSPALASMLGLRARLGVRNVAHTLAKLLDPTDAPGCLRLASFTHPEFDRLQHDYFVACDRPALLSRGNEGEVVASTRRGARIDWLHDGTCDVLVEAQGVAPRETPALPDAHDAPGTARWIQAVLAGERPVPAAIERQVAAVLHAAGRPTALA